MQPKSNMIPQTTIAWQLAIRFAAWQGEYFVDMKISITCATILAEYAPAMQVSQ